MRKRTGPAVTASLVAFLGVCTLAQQNVPAPAPGLWHLLPLDARVDVIPQHRVDIRLYPSPAPFRAAIVNRNTNEDMPYSVVEFDGRTLRLARRSDVPGAQESLVWLQLKWDGIRFVGTYVDDKGQPVSGAVPLKLIRAAQ